MKETIRNQEKLAKLQAQMLTGGKGTTQRKKKVVHSTATADDKKLQFSLKKLSISLYCKQYLWYCRGKYVYKPRNSDPPEQPQSLDISGSKHFHHCRPC